MADDAAYFEKPHGNLFMEGVEAYATAHTTPLSQGLARLERETKDSLKYGNMLCGALEATFLQTMLVCASARRVLEVGCYSGFSALAMAEVLPHDGCVITIDNFSDEPESESICRAAIAAHPHGHKVRLVKGAALDELAKLEGPFDFIFIGV
mmetsp:Transcript_43611/g.110023  ORF Transcript_43611/g.110023 Transcript_43611/m.110023 type:complete len:152 (-) Transcript_43611:20-475(-)